jgi:hypothetical protein
MKGLSDGERKDKPEAETILNQIQHKLQHGKGI